MTNQHVKENDLNDKEKGFEYAFYWNTRFQLTLLYNLTSEISK